MLTNCLAEPRLKAEAGVFDLDAVAIQPIYKIVEAIPTEDQKPCSACPENRMRKDISTKFLPRQHDEQCAWLL